MKKFLFWWISLFGKKKDFIPVENIFNYLPDAIIVVDRRGIVMMVNDACCSFLGYKREEIIGQSASMFFVNGECLSINGKNVEQKTDSKTNEIYLGKILDELVLKGYVSNLEVYFLTRDCRRIPMSFNGVVLRNVNKEIIGVLGIARDISMIKIIEEDKKKQEAMLIQSAKMSSVGELAAGLAHEIGNPLQIILGNVDLLLRRDKSPELIVIKDATLQAKSIISGLLDFARQQEMFFIPADINQLVEKTLSLYGKQLELKRINVVKKFAANLPLLKLSPSHIQQVFLNIIINARKAMPQGGTLTIETALCNGEEQNECLVPAYRLPGRCPLKSMVGFPMVVVSFSDTGKGIEPETLSRVFDPFFTTGKDGTGLGLTISYGIVKKHGGEIVAYSEGPEKGAQFLVHLPVNFAGGG